MQVSATKQSSSLHSMDIADNTMERDTSMGSGIKFTADDIPKIEKLFKEADADESRGLDVEEFRVALSQLHRKPVSQEEAAVLHMKIDTNCNGTVDFGELITYLLNGCNSLGSMKYKTKSFPKPFRKVPVDCNKPIVSLLFDPDKVVVESEATSLVSKIRPFLTGQYLSISEDGFVTYWTERFVRKTTLELTDFRKRKKCVEDMVYISELKQVVVCISQRELLFYSFDEFYEELQINHSLIVEDDVVSKMNYWSNGTKAMFSYGDRRGQLSVFISHDINANGLFCREAFESISLQNYPTVYVSALFKHRQTMAVVSLPKQPKTKCSKMIFKTRGYIGFFTCGEYLTAAERLLSGGRDGLLRVWFPHKSVPCMKPLQGHASPITHVMDIPDLKRCITLSMDKNVRVWCENAWMCLQNFQVEDIGQSPLSSVYYNVHNNELVVANSGIAKCLGRGTDVFQDLLTSHEKPLCCALYHSIYKQVISVCQSGVVTVWDVLTGMAVMEFKVAPEHSVGLIAMIFDGLKSKLITVSQDGKVTLWNFSNGTELAVLPVTVPMEVSGLVCLKNRLYVSSRNSRIIFDLDVEGCDHRSLEHRSLSDISSMDVHDGTLITASSYGNIAVWNAETNEVLLCANASMSPPIQLAGSENQGRVKCVPVDKSPKKVTKTKTPLRKSTALTENKSNVNNRPIILSLKTRESKVGTATLLTTADGYINAWIVKYKGGVLAKFRAVVDEGAVITTMSTDANDQILLTGDSTGSIYLWDIQGFGYTATTKEGPFEVINGKRVSVHPPPLLRSWQAHRRGVVSIQCDPDCNNIITAGLDHNVWLWSKTGRTIGLFGKDGWDATKLIPKDDADQDEEPQLSTDQIISFPTLSPVPSRTESVTPTPDSDLLARPKAQYLPRQALDEKLAKYGKQYPEAVTKRENASTRSKSRLKGKQSTQADLKETSPMQALKEQYPYLFKAKSKFHEKDAFKGSDLVPQPPDSVPWRKKWGQTPNRGLFPPLTCDRIQLTQYQTESKPKNSVPAGRNVTETLPDIRSRVKEESDHMSNHARSPPIHVDSQFKPRPPERPSTKSPGDITKTLSHRSKLLNRVKEGSDHMSNHARSPPIHVDSQFKPRPPEGPSTTSPGDLAKSSSKCRRINKLVHHYHAQPQP